MPDLILNLSHYHRHIAICVVQIIDTPHNFRPCVDKQISAIFWPNRSNCDTSMTFGRNVPLGSLCKKKVLATWIVNVAAIFSKMAAGYEKKITI